MHPDRAAEQQMLDLAAHRRDQLARTVERKTDHIDHHIRLEITDALPKDPSGLLAGPIQCHRLHLSPRGVWLVWRSRTTTDVRSEEHTSELQSRQYLVC